MHLSAKGLGLVLALLITSCGGTGTLRFTGQEFVDNSSGLMVVKGEKNAHLLVGNLKCKCSVILPYAEDWIFEPTPAKPIFGTCSSLRMAVTVQTFQPGKPVDEESYLKTEYLTNLQRNCEKIGLVLMEAEVSRGESNSLPHPVLDYWHEVRRESVEVFRQSHSWSFRQLEDHTILEIHLSKVYEDPALLPRIRAAARLIVGKHFVVTRS